MDEDKIGEMLSRARYRPSPAETDLFVQKVMSALPADTIAANRPGLWQRWFAPAMAFSFAALVVSAFPIYQSLDDDATALLLADAAASAPGDPKSADDVLGFVMEAQ